MDDNTIIARYIEAAARSGSANNASGNALDQNRLEEAARGAGLSDADLAVIAQRRRDLAAMGSGFAAKALWQDAIATWQEACDLSPWDIQPLLKLSEAWLGLHTTGNSAGNGSKALAKAEAATRRVITLHPGDEAAYQLLARIQDLRTRPAASQTTRQGKAAAIILISLALAAVAVLGIFSYRGSGSGGEPVEETVSLQLPNPAAPDQPQPNPTGEIGPTSAPVSIPASDRERDRPIPVDAPPGDWALSWTAIRSSLQRYDLKDPAWAYNLAMAATSGTTAFRELDLAIHFLDNTGNILFTKRERAIQDYQPVHYPGDNIQLKLLVYEKGLPPDIHRVRVEATRAQALSGSQLPPRDSTTPVEWADESGRALSSGLELQLRRAELSGGFNQRYLYVDIGYSNKGPRSFNKLKFRCEWYDEQGTLVSQDSTWGFIQGSPLFEAGRQGVCGFILSGPADSAPPARLRIVVEEASLL